MDKSKITTHQLFSLVVGCSAGGSIIAVAGLVTSIAKQDAWITGLVTVLFGLPVVWIYWFLGNEYPQLTIIGMMKKIFGKWIGLFSAFTFVAYALIMACHLPWYISDFMITEAMPYTPPYVINLLFVVAIVIAMLYGIEAIARTCELLITFASVSFFVSMLMVLPNARLDNLKPVFEFGILPILKGSVFLSSYITFPLILIMMIYPINLNNTKEAKKALLKGYVWSAFIIFIGIIMAILVLGSKVTAVARFPTYFVAKEINLGVIFTRLEFIVDVSWIATEFMVGLLFFYAGIIGLAELLKLKNYRKLVIPFGLIVLVMSEVIYPDVVYQSNWIVFAWAPYSVTYGLIFPFLMFIVHIIKKHVMKR